MLLAGPISHTSTQYMDYVDIFNISLDLFTTYFAHFSGCSSFVYSCYSIQSASKHGQCTFLCSAMGELVCNGQLWGRAALGQLCSYKVR